MATSSELMYAQNLFFDSKISLLTDCSGASDATALPIVKPNESASQNIILIDSAIENYQYFIDHADPNSQVFVLDSDRSGIDQITSILSEFGDQSIATLQLVSHGSSGSLQIGNSQLDRDTLTEYADKITGWSRYLGDQADILLYGCEVAQGSVGQKFVEQFASLTGADIAASNDLTGSLTLGGDWDLEFDIGTIDLNKVLSVQNLEDYSGLLTTPVLRNAIVSGTTANSEIVLIYDERLDGNSDPAANRYTVTVNGANRTVTQVDVRPGTSAEGTTVHLTLANPIVRGNVVRVSYSPGGAVVQDLAGNDALGFSNRAVRNLRNFALSSNLTRRVSDVFDFTQFGYTYDYGYTNNFNTLPSTAAQRTGLEERKNAVDMTPAEIDAYINAVLTLKRTTVLSNNGIEISLYDQFVAAHVATSDAIGRRAPNGSTMGNPAHGGPAFMPWHRILLSEYEEALQAVNPRVVLPFWDWTNLTASNNVLFQNNYMGPINQGNVTSGYFSLANGWGMRRDLSGSRWTGINASTVAINRQSRVTNPGTWANNITTYLGQANYTQFAQNAESGTGAHNNAHGSIGGIMSNVAASPNDPLFWMLHANVDRLWAEWQISNHWGTSFYTTGTQRYGHNLNDSLFLWDNGAIPIATDLRDILPRFPGSNTATVVSGNRTLQGTLRNSGVVSPGNSPGIIHVDGDYIQSDTGKLTIELAGYKSGKEYDVLKVDGSASLNGTLNLYFLDDFVPECRTFTFLKADSIEGNFTDVQLFGLETPVDYKLFKSKDGQSYKLKITRTADPSESRFGVAQNPQALYEDSNLSLYNPQFGLGLDMYIYGYGHHGWGDSTVDIWDHSGHTMTNWYLPYDVDINEWILKLDAGAAIPEDYMSPMMHDMESDMNHGASTDPHSHQLHSHEHKKNHLMMDSHDGDRVLHCVSEGDAEMAKRLVSPLSN